MHLWLGLLVGIHLTLVCISGSLLVFRSELQRAAFPQLLSATQTGTVMDASRFLAAVQDAYPGQRVSGIDAPTQYRQTYLAYVVDRGSFRTILADPASGRILGELPRESWVATLQSLHFNLLLGKTGQRANQIAAASLLGLLLSGAVIWWQGRRRWPRALRIRGGPWPELLRNLHSAVGAWSWLAALMISLTACSLMFPQQWRMLAMQVSPPSPSIGTPARPPGESMTAAQVLRIARELHPGEYISRVVLPADGDTIYQVNFAATQPTPLSPGAQTTLYFDGSTGLQAGPTPASRADRIIAWSTALHVGNFAGNATRVAWALMGLLPPLLFITGALLWWRRVVRPARRYFFGGSTESKSNC